MKNIIIIIWSNREKTKTIPYCDRLKVIIKSITYYYFLNVEFIKNSTKKVKKWKKRIGILNISDWNIQICYNVLIILQKRDEGRKQKVDYIKKTLIMFKKLIWL